MRTRYSLVNAQTVARWLERWASMSSAGGLQTSIWGITGTICPRISVRKPEEIGREQSTGPNEEITDVAHSAERLMRVNKM